MSSTLSLLQAVENRKPMPPTKIGCFVRTTTNNLGVGKLVALGESTADIEYFDSVGAEGRIRHEVPRASIRRARIPSQTRCWFEQDGVWQVGRVIELLDSRYAIFLPNQQLARLTEPDFFVRWDRPVIDPMDVLIANAFDTPLFHALRRPFIDEALKQRAACQGMTAITSSCVNLYRHQIDVVARVLVDDRQRYILADEVGLGKTIEAGMIIRQRMIDDPTEQIVVAVPKFLIHQWQEELALKFDVAAFGGDAVRVISHSELSDVAGSQVPGLLVIDEAHLLMPTSHAERKLPPYVTLQGLARQSGAILLLTATPLLHNESAFLAMLHLLDPDAYDVDDLDSFKQKILERQALALRLNGLRTPTPDFLLQRHVQYLVTSYPHDPALRTYSDSVLDELNNGRSDEFDTRLQALSEYVRDTYRLHRRVLKNRRGGEKVSGFTVRGRAGANRLAAPEQVRLRVNDWLDEWRQQLANDYEVTETLAGIVTLVLECSGSDLRVLEEALLARSSHEPRPLRFLAPVQAQVLRALPVSVAERGLLNAGLAVLQADSSGESRVAHVVELLGDMSSAEKAVVFTGFPGVARKLAASIADDYGDQAIARHFEDMSPGGIEDEVTKFREQKTCQFMVCDGSAELGRNLQWADRLVHVDLPWSPNRLEQRLGRLDRYGEGSAVDSTVFADGSPGSFADAWLGCLEYGFGVFSQSIATLQHPVEDVMRELGVAVVGEGIHAIHACSVALPARLDRERTDIESLEALESISDETEFCRDLYTHVLDNESTWDHRQQAAEDWISDKPGHLRFYKERDGSGLRRYLTHPPERRPRAENLPLVPWDILMRVFEPWLDRRGSYSRSVAVRYPGARLFGVGDQFIDALTNFSRWDSRGQAFGMWRRSRAWLEEPEIVAFRLDFIAGPDVSYALASLGEAGTPSRETTLRRLSEAYFPPVVYTVWLDSRASEVVDLGVKAVLEQPFDQSHGDAHLTPGRRWALDNLLPCPWTELCVQVRREGESLARSASPVVHASERAVARAETALSVMLGRRRSRSRSLSEAREADELAWLDQSVVEAIKSGLREPQMILDAAGCVVIAGAFPDGWHSL